MFKKRKSVGIKEVMKVISERFRDFRKGIEKRNPSFLKAESIPNKCDGKQQRMLVDVTSVSVAKGAMIVMLTLLAVYFLYEIAWILLIFFLAFLLAAALDPLIDKMKSIKIPRMVSMLIVYVVLFYLLGIFVTKVGFLMAEQVVGIAQSVGDFVSSGGSESIMQLPYGEEILPYFQQFTDTIGVETAATQLQNAFNILSTQLVSISFGLINLIIVLVLAFFMVVEEESIEVFFRSMFPARYGHYISDRLLAIKYQIGLWLRGQLYLSIVAALLSYVGLALMGIEYAFTLSIIAGVLMVIPVFGRFFAWILTVIIVFNQSPTLALWMTIYYFIVSQVESNVVVPYIMNKAVGLSPIVVIFAMMVGGHYLGIVGFIISIPIAAAVAIFVRDYSKREK